MRSVYSQGVAGDQVKAGFERPTTHALKNTPCQPERAPRPRPTNTLGALLLLVRADVAEAPHEQAVGREVHLVAAPGDGVGDVAGGGKVDCS